MDQPRPHAALGTDPILTISRDWGEAGLPLEGEFVEV